MQENALTIGEGIEYLSGATFSSAINHCLPPIGPRRGRDPSRTRLAANVNITEYLSRRAV